MKKDWTIKKLGELVTTINGLWKGKKPPFVNVAVIRNTNFSKDCQLKLDDVEYLDVEEKQFKTRQLHMGDIIIEKSGGSEKQPVGRPILFNIQDDNYSFSNFTSTLRINNQKEIWSTFLQQYLYHRWLEGDTKSLQSHTTGIHNLDFKGFLNFDIPVPPLEEQKRIVAVLEKKFAQIETLKTAAEKNLQNAKQLFQSELEKAFSNTTWEKKRLEKIANIKSGFAFKSSAFKTEGEYQVLRLGNVKQNYLRVEEKAIFVSDISESDFLKAKVNIGDLVVTQTGTKGKRDYGFVAIVDRDNLLLNQRLAAITVSEELYNRFLLYYSYTEDFKNQFFANEGGTVGQGNIGLTDIKEIEIPLPPLEEQKRIVAHLDSLSEKVHQLEEIYTKQLTGCDELKQSLLQKAFEGEL